MHAREEVGAEGDPDGALCSCRGLSPRSQQDGGASPGSEQGFGCLSLRACEEDVAWKGSAGPVFLPPCSCCAFHGRGHSWLPPPCGCWVLPHSSLSGHGGHKGDLDICVPTQVAQLWCAAKAGPGRVLGYQHGYLTVFPVLKPKGSASEPWCPKLTSGLILSPLQTSTSLGKAVWSRQETPVMESCPFPWGLFPANPPLCCRAGQFPSGAAGSHCLSLLDFRGARPTHFLRYTDIAARCLSPSLID